MVQEIDFPVNYILLVLIQYALFRIPSHLIIIDIGGSTTRNRAFCVRKGVQRPPGNPEHRVSDDDFVS
jgi:hypothetical protein